MIECIKPSAEHSNFLDENCDITWKNRPLNLDGNSAYHWNVGNHELSDFDIEGHYMKKIRVAEKATGRFNISEPPALYSKQRRSEGDHDFRTPYGTWYPTLERNCDFRDCNKPSSMVLLLRGKATKRSPSNSAARQNTRRHGGDIRNPVNRSSVENVYAKYRNYAQSDDRHERKRINGPGNFTKTWNPSSSNPNHFSNHIVPKNLGPEDSFLFEKGYISADRDLGFGSFCQTPGTKRRAPADAKLWIEDPFGSYLLPEVHSNVKSSFQRPKHDFLHEFSPPVSFSSEKLAFCRPHSQTNSYATPIFSTVGCGRCKPNLFVDSKVEDKLRDLFPAVGSQGDAEKTDALGSNDLSSENGEPLEESDSKDNCSDFKEAKDLTPELENEKATGSPEHAEETSSSVKIPEKFEHGTDEKECHNDAQVSLRQKNENTGFESFLISLMEDASLTDLGIEIDDSGPKERKLDNKVQTNSLDPSYDGMMLESFVLQLLCVQKVLKEPSGNHTVKKEERKWLMREGKFVGVMTFLQVVCYSVRKGTRKQKPQGK
ncbi:hypothetical protein Acr_13g0007750 [Actinidia rufa]|uniref:Uncharacterized protein n=1 Tax=Actinidia rufa TaxID=165716 RepID=A0A7J0FKZ1_9ERIC|nr:hypothetical protein Acr_13g0007750 [Actinidia rufa]